METLEGILMFLIFLKIGYKLIFWICNVLTNHSSVTQVCPAWMCLNSFVYFWFNTKQKFCFFICSTVVHDVSIKTPDVMFPQQTLFLLILPGTLCVMGQGRGQVPAIFNCSVFVAKDKTTTDHWVQEIQVNLCSMGSTSIH